MLFYSTAKFTNYVTVITSKGSTGGLRINGNPVDQTGWLDVYGGTMVGKALKIDSGYQQV